MAGHAVRVHLFNRRREQQVATGFEELFLIGGEGARVFVEVFAGAELQRVDENTRDDEIDSLRSLGDQCDVAAVQVAHGRHEADALAFTARASDGGTQFAYGFDGVHAENPCSMPGNVVALTSLT